MGQGVPQRLTPKQRDGFGSPPSKVTQLPSTISGSAINEVKAFLRITPKQRNGFGSPPSIGNRNGQQGTGINVS